MKKDVLKRITKSMLIVMMAMLVVVSCKKDDEEETPGPTPVEDGIYVTGAATGVATPGINGLMSIARNEVTQEDRAELKEIYMAVSATDGFNIVVVSGSTTTTYGPGADFAEVTEPDGDEPTLGLWRGSLVETADKFTVPSDGLYHIAYDEELMIVVVARVEWGVIGAATPGGWGESTALPSTGFDLNTMTFEITDLTLTKADWKFKYSNGWKLILDPDFDLGGGDVGIKVNSNFGGAVDALVAGGDNIVNDASGKYTATMVWTLGGGHTATMTKTADLEIFDYTNTELGLIGNALIIGGVQQNWEVTAMVHVPVVEGETNYTWTWEGVEVVVTDTTGFKIREGQDWTQKSIGYNDVTMAGLSADDFGTNGDGNFIPLVAGTYDMVLFINAETDTYTFTVNPVGAAPELYMLGDGCAAGWDNTLAIPLEGTGGVYTITTDFPGGGEIKFITTLGQWAPMYGTDDNGTITGGILVYRETESDPDPVSIPMPDNAQQYTIHVNTNDMTYQILN